MSTTNTSSTTINTNTNTNTSSTATTNNVDVTGLIKSIEQAVNPKTMAEGIKLLDNPDKLVGLMQAGADQFKEKTGRNMTYSEMRQMYG